MKPHTIAVIPARGGSTRIHKKNLAPLGGHPLLAYTVDAALRSGVMDGVYVSTQDEEIGAVARQYGATIIWRPEHLASATSQTEPALVHAVEQVEEETGRAVDLLVMLQATSPLRGPDRIEQAVSMMISDGCDSVTSVVPDVMYHFLSDLGPEGRLLPRYDPKDRPRTQDITPRYCENGAIFVMTRSQIIERGCRMGGDMRALIMEEWESVDIDTELDLAVAEAVMAQRGLKGPK